MNWKGYGSSSCTLIEVLPRKLLGGTDENHEIHRIACVRTDI
jgi:hypothetical protein